MSRQLEINLKTLILSAWTIALIAAPIPRADAATFELPMNQTVAVSSVADNDILRFAVVDNASYCCQISSENVTLINMSLLTPGVSSGAVEDSAPRGASSPFIGTNSIGSDLERRQCFRFVEDPATTNARAQGTITVDVASGAPTNVIIRCDETTLYGGFNTAVTDFNFLEVTNTLKPTDVDNMVKVTIKANANLAGTEVINQTLTLGPGERFDVDVHSNAAADFGPVVVTHNGPKGAIRVVNAQYRIVTPSPLDFEPVLAVTFAERP